MLRPYLFAPGPAVLRRPVSRGRRHLYLSHHPIGKAGRRREARQLHQLQNHPALSISLDSAERAVGKVHRLGGREQPLRPELDFIGGEMHGEVSHWVPYGLGFAPVSVPAIFEINPQFITGPMDIGFDRAQRQFQRVGDFLVGIPLDVS